MQDSERSKSGTTYSTDYEQSAVRLINCAVVLLYTTICYFYGVLDLAVPIIYLVSIPFSLAILYWSKLDKSVNKTRRILGMLADLGTTTASMSISGEAATPLFIVYMWTTFGNGFRYGKDYLYLSMTLSILGFSLVIFLSPYWKQHLFLASGLMLTLSVLPIYISALLSRIHAATEEAKQASLAKSQFLASMSHEIRTPLNGVVGMSDMLSTTRMTKEQQEYASTIRSSAKTLLALIENILDFSKIEAGRTEKEDIKFDLHELIYSVTGMLFPQAEKKGISSKLHISADVPFQLEGDSIHLRQILINLLGNAVKFTETGAIELNLFTVERDGEKATLRFEVIDTGIGMKPEDQESIFDEFSQADQSISRRFGGTGLGTAISKKLVDLLDGTIGVESELGKGSKFWFELPYVCHTVQTEYIEASSTQGNAATILLVGSNAATNQTILKYLEEWDFEADQADNVHETLHLLGKAKRDEKPYDVVLVDHAGLGGESDIDALALKISADPLTRSTNLILISKSKLDPGRELSFLSSGYFCVLNAPVEKRYLFNALHATSMVRPDGNNVTKFVNFDFNTGTTTTLNILVGEDNATNQKVIRTILEYAGFNVDIYANGDEVLDAIEEKYYDLVVLDMHMPEMNGIDTAKAIRFMRTGQDRCPIVMLTADATVNAIKACEEADIDVYLTKPIDSEKLLSAIARLATGKEEQEDSSPTMAQNEVLNLQSLDKLASLNSSPDFIGELIDGFISDTMGLIAAIKQAADKDDFHAVQEHAHAIKGSAYNIGADSLAQCAAAIVSQNKEGVPFETSRQYRKLDNEFQMTISALKEYLSRLQSSAL